MFLPNWDTTDQHILTPGGCLALGSGELRANPGIIGPTTRLIPGNPASCPRFLVWLRQDVTGDVVGVQRFCRDALWGNLRGERLIAKGDLDKSDLVGLWKILEYVLGDYAGRISRYGWEQWPGRLESHEREMLGRARLVFLPSIERHERFPQAATEEMLGDVSFGWFSCRGRNYPCHARFFYPAPLRKIERLENTLVGKIKLLEGPRDRVHPEGPEVWLAEEAPHILAWLLHTEGR